MKKQTSPLLNFYQCQQLVKRILYRVVNPSIYSSTNRTVLKQKAVNHQTCLQFPEILVNDIDFKDPYHAN